ncbi:MAG: hypothetical protein IPP72_04440 [Chitinophagaceae bacterium]|nr:hypothetical protein [Chitinophagaceae bacterium]
MKKFLLLASACFMMASSFAQSEKFVAAMKKNIADIDSGFKNPPYLLTVANNFERIATAEKTEWLPYYYAALLQVNYGFMEQDKTKIDAIADKATTLINKADSLAPDNSEISCIKSMIASCHMMVNPMQRWQEYGPASSSNMQAAINQDPTNPRPYLLKGQGLRYTPEQFGGGCKTASVELQKALDMYAAFKPAGDLYPTWGKDIAQQLIDGCK